MTTKVTIEANHGWPVDVTAIHPVEGNEIASSSGRIAAGETRVFHVHSGQDLIIHEVQPDEIEEERAEAASAVSDGTTGDDGIEDAAG